MNCPICNKQFSRVSNLNKHRRTSQCSKINACPECRQCFIMNMSEHTPHCVQTVLKKNIELERKISELESKIENMTHERLDELQPNENSRGEESISSHSQSSS